MSTDRIEQAAAWISEADGLLITAGAGMGIDSGLPDFRGDGGFWKAYPALGKAGISFTEVANPGTFRSQPELAWGFYGHRLALYRRTVPHYGFGILRNIADRMVHGAFVFTSNVDGQFQKAGFPADAVYECHGTIHDLQCLEPCTDALWPARFDPEVDDDACRMVSPLPRCPGCGRLARPNILMFNDWGWIDTQARAAARRLAQWRARVGNLVILEFGAGTHIPSVRHYSEANALQGRLVRINPGEAQLSPRLQGISLPMGALAALKAINDALYDIGYWAGG